MRFIFCTDLHGDVDKYLKVLSFAMDHEINLIHLGADLLPKGSEILRTQRKFVNGFLQKFYKKCHANKIRVLAHFGNDDIYTRKKHFRKFASLLDETPYESYLYTFKAYGFVPDLPFSLKTACKLDYRGWKRPHVDHAIDILEKDFIEIPDIDAFLAGRSTIEEDLKEITGGRNVILSSHCPPASLGLDVLVTMQAVGSKSLYDWIDREQPLLVLCGHIHESYSITKIWKAKVGRTTVIQPGQGTPTKYGGRTHLVLIEIDEKGEVQADLATL